MAKKLIAKKPFEFSARVTLQLGRESISSSTVAISELIKNSYDADSEVVNLEFYLRENGAVSTLLIKDDGVGMDEDTLFDHWLKIGTNNKVLNGRSVGKKRVFTGAKGLGRLGIDRLCKKLILYTKKKGADKAIQLNVDWSNFENTDKLLHEIHHDIYEVDLPINDKYGDIFSEIDEQGTYLILLGLKDEWTPEFLSALSNEIRLLISPYRSQNDFSVHVTTINKGGTTRKTISSEDILSSAHWKIKSSVDRHGRVSAVFTNNESSEEVTLKPIDWNIWIKNERALPLFGPLTFEFHFLPRNTVTLAKLNLKARDWKQFMDLNRGVRIYRDDFRVRPYGEPSGKGDWLDLGFRKASNPSAISQGNWNIGPHQIVGAISITRKQNSILDDQANREGLIESEAFYQMRAYVLKVIETFEDLISKDSQRNEDTDLAIELSNLLASERNEAIAVDNLKKVTFTKRSKRKKKALPPAMVLHQRIKEFERAKAKREEALDDYYKLLEKEREKLKEEKDTLSNLASLGILTVFFGHEIRTHSSLALENTDEILDLIKDSETGKYKLDYGELREATRAVKDSVSYVDNFSKLAINNIKPDKRTRKKINVPSVFGYIFNLMKSTLDRMGVEYEFKFVRITRSDFKVRSYEIDWESIAINLLTNSLWALENVTKASRKIVVTFERVGGTKLKIIFKDSGCGLEAGMEESIFLPMKSSKRDRIGNSIGTGMGLAIVRTHITEHMAGNIFAEVSSDLGGAAFHIEVQQDV